MKIKAVRLLMLGITGSLIIAEQAFAQSSCDAVQWKKYHDTRVMKVPKGGAYFYATRKIAIDADGAPNAYHPLDKGIDALSNAGYPGHSWKNVLVRDPNNSREPFIQTEGEFKGYFVSKTSLQDDTLPVTDPGRYADSRTTPYLVFPGAFLAMSGTGGLGDIGVAKNLDTGEESAFIVADAGPRNAALGEVSIRLAENLGGRNVNPRNGTGVPKGQFLYVLFPKSRFSPRWPVNAEEVNRKSQSLLQDVGGWERLVPCVGRP